MAMKVVEEVQSVYGKKKWKKAVIKDNVFPKRCKTYSVYVSGKIRSQVRSVFNLHVS